MKMYFLHNFFATGLMGLAGVAFIVTPAFGQIAEIKNSYERFNVNNLHEKIYVHTDRSTYLCGEIIWFKAYLTDAANNRPLSLSKVIYIEVLDQRHQPVLQGKIAAANGFGSGSFYLPFSMVSGNYQLRAYTNWMKNFSPGLFFKKNITIINTTVNLDSAARHESVNYHASFFPEGGNMVIGLQSEIAFKINDNYNKGSDAAGVIVDQVNDTVARFKTLRFGMGHFYLIPQAEKEYMAVITCKDGTVIRQSLPKAYNAGYVMHVADTGANDIKISVSANALQQNENTKIYIIIQNNRSISIAKMLNIENDNARLIINKDSLKEGVSQITVFDSDKHPRCERLYFKRPKNKMLILAEADKKDYPLRSKVSINISTADNQSQNFLPGNLSVSVYRLDSMHLPGDENIFSYLWLSSNLRGSIEDPGYYFSNENAETNEALDNLLLSQGWRKFDWDKVWENKTLTFKYVPEYSGHIITGRVTSESTLPTGRQAKKPVPGLLVYLSVPGRRVQLEGCVSDSAGMIHFDMKDFFGAGQIVVQTHDGDESAYHVEIFSPFSETYGNDPLPAFYVSEREGEDLQKQNLSVQIENAYHEKELRKLSDPLVDSIPFYVKPYKTFMLDDYTRFTTMEEVLREYVDEINVRKKGSNFRLMTLNIPAFALKGMQFVEPIFEKNPLVLLDGVPVFDINKIIAYDPLKVQKLEVVASRYHWGPITADGIASFTTYKGNLEGFTLDPHDLLLDYDGLQKQRIFYSPDYSAEKQLESRLPDFRTVLYWSPEVITSDKGNTPISFYTGDVPGKYWIDIQGISAKGEAGSGGFTINVMK